MKRTLLAGLLFLAISPLQAIPGFNPAKGKSVYWTIGKSDRSSGEFAMAPAGHRQFRQDGFYIVGVSKPEKDWPYVQPGPADMWAGGRQHTFIILFGMDRNGAADSCRLSIDLTDTHNASPPLCWISVNGQESLFITPKGGTDESINGKPEEGKPYSISHVFPANLLRKGTNEIRITSQSGSWMLYDALKLEGPAEMKQIPVGSYLSVTGAVASNGLIRDGDSFYRELRVTVQHAGDPVTCSILAGSVEHRDIRIDQGSQVIPLRIPEVSAPGRLEVVLKQGSNVITKEIDIRPVRKMTVYILPHSHTDIGYTEIQTAIEDKQVNNLVEGIRFAGQTAGYPEGSRFVWNVEVAWAADLYLNRLDGQARQKFMEAAKNGQISFNGMYLNELTGLCRPEELLRLFKYSGELERLTGQKIDAAMISDVPGYTWGTVTAMAQAGIRYFSVAPNYFDRIGDILVKWENRPFWWVSPSGLEKVLVWIPLKGYALSHTIGKLSDNWVSDYMEQLDETGYPYDIAHIRWSGHGDNAVPDPSICDFVRDWNSRHAWPKFIISSTGEAFGAFEKAYGAQIPSVAGDWTPYWEDGAGSSARETAMNRNTADRLSQAQVIRALQDPGNYPANRFEEAWKKVLLYSEHTWGAWCSITDPENKMTVEQWEIKKSYADDAERMTGALIADPGTFSGREADVVNTTGWTRNDMVFLSKEQSSGGDRVTGPDGRPLLSQRLSGGELAVAGLTVAPYSSVRVKTAKGKQIQGGSVSVQANRISNNLIECEIDPATGDIIRLADKKSGRNLIDRTGGQAANRYLFFEGNDTANLITSGRPEIRILEPGPVAGALEIVSEAPGANRLVRQLWLGHDCDYVVVINTVDKKRAPMPAKTGDWFLAQNKNKESVNFGFPFSVPGGILRIDLPIGWMVPEADQIPSACKNWFSVGRWADVSGTDQGITWVTLDAPLAEIGGITANLVGSQSNPDVWRKKVEPTQRIFSWVMNNHWGTNYRQYQEGPVTFRYVLRPHGGFDPVAATRFSTGFSQPLLVRSVADSPYVCPFEFRSETIVPITLKPADDGEGFVMTLYNPARNPGTFSLEPRSGSGLWKCDSGENRLEEVGKVVKMAGQEILSVRFK